MDPNTKKKVLQSIGSKWRAFKTTLTRNIIQLKDQPRELESPPKEYDQFIRKKEWDEFVADRLSAKFEV